MIKIAAVGDIMPGGVLAGVDDSWVSEDVLSILNEANVRVGTLETAIGNEPNFYDEKMDRLADVIYAKDHDLNKLLKLGIDLVSLANNHFFDLGPEGAMHTLQLLDEFGIRHIGAGRNIKEASAPVIINIKGNTIAFLAFCDWRKETVGWCPFASESSPGVNPMFDDYVESEILKYKKQYDYIVVLPHWGIENTWITTPKVFRLAKKMLRAGADLILGGHPHRVQPLVNYKLGSVAYSLGNFLFPDRLIVPPRSTFYGDHNIDYSKLPTTEGYPYVKELTYKKWKPLARIGMIVLSELSNNTVISYYKLVQLNDNNVLSLYENKKISSILSKRRFILKYIPYPFCYNVERFLKAIFRRLYFWGK